MNVDILGYVIVNLSSKKKEYVAYDITSGGYPYWTTFISAAHLFSNKEDAEEILKSSEFTRSITMSNGSVYPPPMVHNALNLNYSKMKGAGSIAIMPLTLGEAAKVQIITGEIKHKE